MKCIFCGAEVNIGEKCSYCGSRAESSYYHQQIEVHQKTPQRHEFSRTYELKDGIYTVKRGDSLWGIAKALLGSGQRYTEIAKANHIKNPNLIYPGQNLKIL